MDELKNVDKLLEKLNDYYEMNKEYFKVIGIKIPRLEEIEKELKYYQEELGEMIVNTTKYLWIILIKIF